MRARELQPYTAEEQKAWPENKRRDKRGDGCKGVKAEIMEYG